MQIAIELKCPQCHSGNIVRNGKKINSSQNYLYKECRWQFIADYEKTYRGSLSGIVAAIKNMVVRGAGIRDTAGSLKIRANKILKTLKVF
ncbi:MAG: hypothetical protein LBG87_06295 [Spirochaetaceae bacterium]|jgi:transposase-like protein|nr:hypothetical protein [Spirochaetaceae bacterium]